MNNLEHLANKMGRRTSRDNIAINEAVQHCSLCKRLKTISSKKFNMCSTCYLWCYNWIKRKYGRYSRLKLSEAMNAYFEPDICEYCDNPIPIGIGESRKKKRKINVCEKCMPIYKKAYADVYKREKRSGRYRTK